MKNVLAAIKIVLKNKKYLTLAFGIALVAFSVFVIIPVFTIPGNDILFQLSIFEPSDYILMVPLAVLIGITFSVQLYGIRNKRIGAKAGTGVQVAASGASGIFAAILGSAFCLSCLAPLFALFGLGLGSVFFVLEYQPYFLVGAILFMLISLFMIAHRVNKTCETC